MPDMELYRVENAQAAERLALHLVIRSLVDAASAARPALRDEVVTSMEDWLTRLDPASAKESDFAQQARSALFTLIRPIQYEGLPNQH